MGERGTGTTSQVSAQEGDRLFVGFGEVSVWQEVSDCREVMRGRRRRLSHGAAVAEHPALLPGVGFADHRQGAGRTSLFVAVWEIGKKRGREPLSGGTPGTGALPPLGNRAFRPRKLVPPVGVSYTVTKAFFLADS